LRSADWHAMPERDSLGAMSAGTAPATVFRSVARSLTAITIALLLAGLAVLALAASARASTDAELRAILQLPGGEIDLPLETDVLQSFDEEGAPFLIQVFDGCAINDRYWVFAAGLGTEGAPLRVVDDVSLESHQTVVPPYVPGEPIPTAFDPEALDICRDAPAGGLPELSGTATYSTVSPRCSDGSDEVLLLAEGRPDAYASLMRDGERHPVIGRRNIAIRDDSPSRDELFLLAEGRTPGVVEGVRFSGDEGMLPRPAQLDRAIGDLTRARIRRAFEAAKNKLVPDQLTRDLGLRGVGCVFHVGLDFDAPGAPAYLAQAGWIRGGRGAVEPPQLVEQRFDVELVRADGTEEPLPLTGPWQDAPGDGTYWEHASETAMVRILDGCSLGGTFWTVAAAVTDEPLELVLTDTQTGSTARYLLWTDRAPISRVSDTTALPCV
jgi:hypothetical protein